MKSISFIFLPWKRKPFVIKLKRTQPALKISILVVAEFLFNNSGATYPGVPHFNLIYYSSFSLHARPRSAIWTINFFLSMIKILSGFRSRWIIYFLWIKSSAKRSYSIIVRIWSSVNQRCYINSYNIDPYLAYFMTKLITVSPLRGNSLMCTISNYEMFSHIFSSLKKVISFLII